MKAVIETTFKVRDNNHSTYYSFPVFSEKIEETLCSQLQFLERLGGPYTLALNLRKS
jgi:hypothetical protein